MPGACDAPSLTLGTPTPRRERDDSDRSSTYEVATPAAIDTDSAAVAVDAATAARIVTGIENFVACRNAGDYGAYAALLTPHRMLAEAGTTNPRDVVASLEDFNLPITTLALDDVRMHPDGRFSAEFVHLFGPHLYYRSRLYVVDDGDYVRFDEERYLPEEPPGEQTVIAVRLVDFGFASSQDTIENAPFVILRGANDGSYPHEIVVVRLPEGTTAEQVLAGGVPEDEIEFVGQTTIAPGETDELVLADLQPGSYTLLCFVDEPDGVPHAARGMVARVTIEGTAAPTP
jgi:uncharacterized cupredoxin-like copper-binding protein